MTTLAHVLRSTSLSPPKPAGTRSRMPSHSTRAGLQASSVETPISESSGELGFTFRSLKRGEVEILSRGRRAAILRKHEAEKFLTDAAFADSHGMQQLMARLTGNFKRGNE